MGVTGVTWEGAGVQFLEKTPTKWGIVGLGGSCLLPLNLQLAWRLYFYDLWSPHGCHAVEVSEPPLCAISEPRLVIGHLLHVVSSPRWEGSHIKKQRPL